MREEEKQSKKVKAKAKAALLTACVVLYLGFFVYALALPKGPVLTEVSSVQVADTPVPVLLLPTSPPAEAPPVQVQKTLNLNEVDGWMLCAVPGIGEELAQRIIAYRDAMGGFTELSELLRVSGIGEHTYARIAPYLRCE